MGRFLSNLLANRSSVAQLSESFPAWLMEPRFPSGVRLESSICDQHLVESTPEREILVAEAFDCGFDCS